jgi:2-keto-4-pentenoate hydratase
MADATGTRPEAWEDPRVVEGTRRQLAERDRMLADGARRLGWKLGLGAPPARQKWGIKGPVAGFITDATLLDSGATQSLVDFTKPVLEAEVAVRVAVGSDGPRPGALGLAIELADLGSGTDDLAELLGGDIFHRRTVLGAFDGDPAATVGTVSVVRDGAAIDAAPDPTALVGGTPAEMTAYLDRYLSGVGEELRDGDVIITGSTVALVDCSDGGHFAVTAPGFATVEVTLTPSVFNMSAH